MEHNLISNILNESILDFSPGQIELISAYVKYIYDSNKKFNLTGLKNIEDMVETLIVKSIVPMSKKNVPRGTFFLDMGTGAGVPGIPLAIYFENFYGLLVDSNQKKISFLTEIVSKLKIKNVEILCHRAEDLAVDQQYREKFNWVFSRGVGEPFVAMELGAAFVSINGFLVIYSNEKQVDISKRLSGICLKYGLEILNGKEKKGIGLEGNVVVFRKIESTEDRYPRRYSVIKRESKKIR